MSHINQLYYGDNYNILKEHIEDESIDLIYLDPPFNSNVNYNVFFNTASEQGSIAQTEAFQDTWNWTEEAELAYKLVFEQQNTALAELLRTLRSYLGESDMMAYLVMMAVRLVELHRVLKSTGSIYLHCDSTASHYLKILMDAVFGPENYRNEVIWKRTSSHSDGKRYGRVHDVIFFYSKSDSYTWNTQYEPYSDHYIDNYYNKQDEDGRRFMSGDLSAAGLTGGGYEYEWNGHTKVWRLPKSSMQDLEEKGYIYYTKNGIARRKRYLDESKGLACSDTWTDIEALRSWHKERLGYPTQKPLALLERLISASSNEGDVVLDPFCGCGTALHAAEKLNRNWLGIDITHLAIALIEYRLTAAFSNIQFETVGTPQDLAGARDLAKRDKHQFEWWALSLVDAVPYNKKKKGADSGIDGLIYFWTDNKKPKRAIVSVKGGKNIGVGMLRDLIGVKEREGAEVAVFITLTPPTKPMITEAVKAGFYESHFGDIPAVQIITIEELLEGKRLQIPHVDNSHKKSFKESGKGNGKQAGMNF